LAEVAGLAEWPVVILGDMDPVFLELPDELIRLTLKTHQKTFTVRDPKTGALAAHYIIVANQMAPDGGEAIKQGNGRDKAERVAALAKTLAPVIGADADKAELAAKLAKCDLVTQTVVEFTSLQGQVGAGMYRKEGGEADIAAAIEQHYKPQGPSDIVPTDPVAVTVALADKLDTLVGFWAIDEKPTGSKDPYALRRAALGVVRIILENGVRLKLFDWFNYQSSRKGQIRWNSSDGTSGASTTPESGRVLAHTLLAFILERLKVYLRDKGVRHDVIEAVLKNGGDDLVDIVNRVNAVQSFLETQEGADLLAGYKRAANILKAAMTALAGLRGPIDDFFEHVTVNDDRPEIRSNNLRLLSLICDTAHAIADFDAVQMS